MLKEGKCLKTIKHRAKLNEKAEKNVILEKISAVIDELVDDDDVDIIGCTKLEQHRDVGLV